MCVIAFSPKGCEAPTEQQIRDMFKANPDGAGFAYNGKNGKVFYKKGFKTVEDLLKALSPLEQWTNKNLGIHFRIGTAGKNDEYTCHPFKISTKYHELRRLEGRGPVLFHNGIVGDGGNIDKNSSDTQDFVAAFAPLFKKYNKSVNRDMWIAEILGLNNKLLIMYDDNKFKAFGKWETDGDIFVSNLNYKYYKYSSDYYNYSSYKYPYKTPSSTTTAVVKAEEKKDTEVEKRTFDEDDVLKDGTPDNYARDDWDLGYEDGGYSEFWAKKEYEQEKKLAEKLYAKVDMENYLELEEGELAILLDWADEYTEDFILKDGKEYIYNAVENQIWTNDYSE